MALRISRITRWRSARFSPRFRAPQIEIAITQARLFVRGQFVLDHERRRLRRVQNAQFAGDDFDFARSEIGIRLLPLHHAPDDGDHKFRAQFLGARVRGGMLLLVENDLRQARAVAQIDENQIAEVAPLVDPAHQDDVFVGVRGAQIAAVMCALQCSE